MSQAAERLGQGRGVQEAKGTRVASPASFRDPSGFVFEIDGTVYRQVNESYQGEYEALIGSGLYQELTERGWMVRHEEVEGVGAGGEACFVMLRPEKIDFISYPYEWSFSQLKDAALLTLDVQLAALSRSMSLKDASAYNIQFRDGRPVFIDTLSFEKYEEGRPWTAYRQFCQHFLAPLALMAKKDIRLAQLLRVHIDGIPLDLASQLLPTRTWFSFGLLSHLHLHARAQRAFSDNPGRRDAAKRQVGRVSKLGLVGLLEGLRNLIAKLSWKPAGTEWGAYYSATNYSDEAFKQKQRLVEDFLAEAAPSQVWDLGGNTGVFSRLASEKGVPTYSFDVDPAAVEVNYLRVRGEGESNLLPLLLDLTNPSPGLGWSSTERDSLGSRGPTGCVMALALVHHLAISNNVPLPMIARFLAGLCETLIIEFVPKEDSQVQRLLSAREDVFPSYDLPGFEAAFQGEFEIVRREPVQGSARTLYMMKSLPRTTRAAERESDE